jgi:hypothetical protein
MRGECHIQLFAEFLKQGFGRWADSVQQRILSLNLLSGTILIVSVNRAGMRNGSSRESRQYSGRVKTYTQMKDRSELRLVPLKRVNHQFSNSVVS